MGHDKVFIKVAVHTHPIVSPEWSLQKKEDYAICQETFHFSRSYKVVSMLTGRCHFLTKIRLRQDRQSPDNDTAKRKITTKK